MRKIFGCFTVLVSVLLILPDSSVGHQDNTGKQKKKKQDTVTKEDATPQDYAALVQAKEVIGKIVDVDVKAGTMTLNIEWGHWEPNPNPKINAKATKANQKALQLQQQLLRDYDQAMRTANPIHRQQALARFQLHLQQLQSANANLGLNLQNMFIVVKSSKDFDLDVMETVKVARVQLEQKYTDEGEVIKYTPEELKKMKSPDMPGYTAVAEDMKTGQVVKIYVSPPKKAPPKKADPDAKKKEDKDTKKLDSTLTEGKASTAKQSPDSKDKQAGYSKDNQDAPITLSGHPQVRMLLIVEDSPTPDPVPDTDKKKKKKG